MSDPTDAITIRVPKSLKTSLEEMSKKNQVNLNLQINQILNKTVEWNEHVTKMGWLQFNPSTVREIFKLLGPNDIDSLVKSTKMDVVNAIKFIYGDTSLEHMVDFMDSWLSSTNTPFRHTENSDSHKFMVNHNLGDNWSIFATKITREFVSELGFTVSDLHSEDDHYSFTIVK